MVRQRTDAEPQKIRLEYAYLSGIRDRHPAAVLFIMAGSAYLLALIIMQLLIPKMKPVEV
jgi:hypothetical protein